jgi:putative chitinase
MTQNEFQQATELSPKMAARWFSPIESALFEFGILQAQRIAMWLAQIGHESGGFVYTREIWGPTPAQSRYEGRQNLGNTQLGDGKRFMGRGLIQTTGRANYKTTGDALGIDLIAHPEMLESDELAARSAAWFWHAHNLNDCADAGNIEGCTRRINGGLNGLEDRKRRWGVAKRILTA